MIGPSELFGRAVGQLSIACMKEYSGYKNYPTVGTFDAGAMVTVNVTENDE